MENKAVIPEQILKKTDSDMFFYEIQSLNFPIPDISSYMLIDPKEIEERQDIFRDIYNCPPLLEKYEKLDEQIGSLADFFTKYGDGDINDNEAIIYSLIKMNSFTETIDYIVSDLYQLTLDSTIKARDMVNFINACVSISESEFYKNIKSWLDKLDDSLKNIKSVTLGVNLDVNFQVREIGITTFNQSPYVSAGIVDSIFRDENPGDEYKCMISLGVKETKRLIGKNIVSVNNEIFSAMNAVFKGVLKKVRRDIIDSFRQDAVAIINIKNDISFIIHASRYMLSIQRQGGNLAFPNVSDCHKIRNLYNINLLEKCQRKNIVANDVDMDADNRIFILTGPNSGGKSVYLNSIGIAQIFFQLGMPVPASSAEMKPFRVIATVYVKNIDNINEGRLADEVIRLKKCLQNLDNNSLILLDETFSSTSAFDGVFLAESLIKYLSDIGCCAFYVTHFHELAQRIEELNKDIKYRIHMLTAQNVDGKRTYKIGPYNGFESETSLAKDIVIEKGLGFLFE